MNIAVYDSSLLFAKGIASVIEDNLSMAKVCILDSKSSIVTQLRSIQSDVLVVDHLGQDGITIQVLMELKSLFNKLRILVVTDDSDGLRIKSLMSAGIGGLIRKSCSERVFMEALLDVTGNGKYFDQSILGLLLSSEDQLSAKLSDRENEIVNLIGKGHTSIEIAEILHLSIHTINAHRKRISNKLGFTSPVELISYAVKQISSLQIS